MKSKKVMALILAAGMMASVAVPVSAEEGTSEEQVTIVVGGFPDKEAKPDSYERKMKKVEEFQKMYPYITVEGSTASYSADTFMALAASGQLPDLFCIPLTEGEKVGESGYVADITDALAELGYLDAYKPEVVEAMTGSDGRIYSYCINAYTFGLMANKSILEEAGLLNEDGSFDAPDTYEELAEMAAQVKEKTGKTGMAMPTINNCGGWYFVSIGDGFGVTWETQNEDGSWTASFNTPEAVEALQYIKDLKWKYDALDANSFLPYDQAIINMGSGQAGFMLGAPNDYILGEFGKNGMTSDEILVFPVPKGTAGRVALGGGELQVFPADITEAELDAALKWLEFDGYGMSISDDRLESMRAGYEECVANGLLVSPVYTTGCWAKGDSVEKINSILSEVSEISYDQMAAYVENTETVLCTEPSVYCQELYAILDGAVQEVITNEDADCAQLIEDAAKDFQLNYLDLE